MGRVSLGRDYLEIALRLGRLVPGWADSYVGPSELVNAVDAQEETSVQKLREIVEVFTERVRREEPEPDRSRWLLAQLRGISTALLWLGGERFTYAAMFERCHGASVELVPDRQFEHAHVLLDRALPGHGDVAARYRAWRQTQLVPRDRLHASLEVLATEMRRLCHERFDLPDDEHVTWELISGEPWAGNAMYLGQRKTRIRVNGDLPVSSHRLLELVCHEAYPGHHTESVSKDVSLVQPAGRNEFAVFVYPTPQALISEGLACYAIEALLAEDADRIAADCLRPMGIPYDQETASVVGESEALLLPVRSNIALMLDGGATSQTVRDYARAWLLDDSEDIDRAIRHLERRSWRPYVSCYSVGLALCRRYVATDRGRFHDLLRRQLTPADLT
jgi:hypothetical protein